MSLRDIFAGMLGQGGGGGGADSTMSFEDLLRQEEMRTGGGGGAGESARDRAAKRYNLSRKGIVSSAYPGAADATKVAAGPAPKPAAPAPVPVAGGGLPDKTDILPSPRPDTFPPDLAVSPPHEMWPGATSSPPRVFPPDLAVSPPHERWPGATAGPPMPPDAGLPTVGATRVMPPVPGTDVPQGGSWFDTGVKTGRTKRSLAVKGGKKKGPKFANNSPFSLTTIQ